MKSVIFKLIICHKCIITSKTKITLFSSFLPTVYELNILKSCYRILKQNETLEGYSKKNFALLLLLDCVSTSCTKNVVHKLQSLFKT